MGIASPLLSHKGQILMSLAAILPPAHAALFPCYSPPNSYTSTVHKELICKYINKVCVCICV